MERFLFALSTAPCPAQFFNSVENLCEMYSRISFVLRTTSDVAAMEYCVVQYDIAKTLTGIEPAACCTSDAGSPGISESVSAD